MVKYWLRHGHGAGDPRDAGLLHHGSLCHIIGMVEARWFIVMDLLYYLGVKCNLSFGAWCTCCHREDGLLDMLTMGNIFEVLVPWR